MSKFKYLAYDAGGRRRSAVVAASSADQVKEMLWSDGLHIVQIQPDFSFPHPDELLPTFIKVKPSEIILFTRQLATFVKVGVPILDGLGVLRDQASSAIMRRALTQIIKDLGTGASLSGALAGFPKIFGRLYVDMISSAEVSGNLDETLRQLANYMSRDESALRKVRNAMIYPAIVLTLAFAVVGVLIGFVLPAFARLFADFRATMPLPTRILLTVGTFTGRHLVAIFVLLGLLVVWGTLYANTARGKRTRDVLLLRVPALGTIVRYAIIERYLRTLATLARSGVAITQMLDTANQSLGNWVFTDRLGAVRDQMLSGEGFAG
ncbi:MAG TPA: type II secretion system F family protein, partial [Candidatus Dormibacteraeota bacterium]|nr:type II secretion system F family protein [Candidatus Dormibacteraeota bacterium]